MQFALWQHAEQIAGAATQEGVAAACVENGSEATGSTRAQEVLAQLGRSVVTNAQVHIVRTATVARVEVAGSVIAVLPCPHFEVHGVDQGPVENVTQASPAR